MRLLFLGDVVGRPGRRAIQARLRTLQEREGAEFVIANCENAAGGKGIDPRTATELFDAGIDILTSGNHVWRRREVVPFLTETDRLLRPANYPPGTPGRGWTVRRSRGGRPVAVINLMGRVFMPALDCPFRAALAAIDKVRSRTPLIVVDMHGEATSEKLAMGRYLDGKVSAVLGSHTHVQTADETVLPGGTAYLTDAGMCGPVESILGVRIGDVIERFVTQLPQRLPVASGPAIIQGAVVDVEGESGRALAIRRIQERVEA